MWDYEFRQGFNSKALDTFLKCLYQSSSKAIQVHASSRQFFRTGSRFHSKQHSLLKD